MRYYLDKDKRVANMPTEIFASSMLFIYLFPTHNSENMAFVIPKGQKPSFSDSESHNVSFSHQDSENTSSVISSQLYLKSSSHQNLDKNVVLRRIRHHKCLHKVRANLQGLLDTTFSTRNYDYEHKWLEQGDVFCSP